MRRTRWIRLVAALAATFLVAGVAFGAVRIYEGRGVAAARLGKTATYNVGKLGKPSKTVVDRQYRMPDGTTRTVYIYSFGKSMGGGRYPLIMYADRKKITFNFTAYSAGYVTGKGIKVGSAEKTLRTAYPSAKRYPGSVYTRYRFGSGPYTEFWVRKGKVYSIAVRR